MSKYINLNYYNGTLGGVEPDFFAERGLPLDKALSPGGLSTIKHHWTEGMGNAGDLVPDVLAGTGNRYPQSIYGNLYAPNAHASVHDHYKGPHTEMTQNQTLSKKPYYWMGKQPTKNRENFTDMGDFELIEGSPMDPMVKKSKGRKQPETFTNVENLTEEFRSTFYFSLVMLFFAFIVASFWSDAIRKFVEQYLNSYQAISWQKYSLYAAGLTVIFLCTVYVFKVEKF